MKKDFNRGWITYATPEPEEWRLPRAAHAVDLPHDANIRLDTAAGNPSGPAGAYYPGCSAEYEKTLFVPADWRGKRISLLFDGVYHNAVVRVNQQFVKRAHYGYTAFLCDLTPFLREGENLIRVSAANKDVPNSRWYTGTGVYRGVELWVQEQVLLPVRGAALTTRVQGGSAAVTASVRVENHTAEPAERRVRVTLRDAESRVAAQALCDVRVNAGDHAGATVELRVPQAKLWSDETPYLYQAEIALLEGERVAEETCFAYGLRTISVSAESGLLLNGKPIKLRGGCIHHDHGILGAASYLMAEEHRVKALKASGFNAIRSAHNPASEALLQACDKYGMLVMDEAFDMWREPKLPYDHSLYFELTWREDIAAMVERDRNHACVIFYSTGNEVPERDGHSEGFRIGRELAEHLRALDPTRLVTSALCNVSPEGVNGLDANLLKPEGQDYFANVTAEYAAPLDVVGYNYMPDRLEGDHRLFPQRVFCATETVNGDLWNGWDKVQRLPCVLGDFVWTAMDYIGEVGIGRSVVDESLRGLAAYPYRLSGCGALDIAGRKKPAAYYRECVWGTATHPYIAVESPAIHDREKNVMWWGWPIVQAYWRYPGWEGKPARVSVYSTAEEVALYVNGRLAAQRKTERCIASFEVPYEPGELAAAALCNGQELSRTTLRTPQSTRRLTLTADKPTLDSTLDDLLYVNVQLTDDLGNPVLDEERTVYLAAEGGATLLAAGNTAIRHPANYADPCQKLYEGHVLAVLRVTGQRGRAVLHCVSEGLPAAELTVAIL